MQQSIYNPVHPDPFGLASWASFNGISADDMLIAACATLVGGVGRYTWLGSQVEAISVAPPHLVYPAGDPVIDAAIQRLLVAPTVLNDRYVENVRSYQITALHAGFTGRPYEVEEAARKQGGAINDSVADRHWRAVADRDKNKPYTPEDAAARTEEDLAEHTKAARYEGLIRPGSLVKGVRPGELLERLAHCNQGHATVVVEGDEWLNEARAWKTTPWTVLLDGADIPVAANKRLGIDASYRRMRAHLIVQGQIESIREAAGDGESPLLDRAILLGLESTGTQDLPDGNRVIEARTLYEQAVKKAFVERRSAIPASGHFRTPQSEWEFMKQKRELLSEIAKSGEGGSLAGILPLADTLALGLLRLGGNSDSDALVLEWAVPVAMRQFRRQRAFLRACRARRTVEREDQLAARIIEKIRAKGTISRRSLIRCFDNQHAATFHPLIERLIAIGSLVEKSDKTLTLPGQPVALKVVS